MVCFFYSLAGSLLTGWELFVKNVYVVGLFTGFNRFGDLLTCCLFSLFEIGLTGWELLLTCWFFPFLEIGLTGFLCIYLCCWNSESLSNVFSVISWFACVL